MRVGTFFHIPDSPTDVERIWHDATPLPSSVLPVWARGEPPDTYRQVQNHRPPMRTEGEAAAYCSEIGELHTAGLIIDTDLAGDGRHRVYVAAPSRWSIGIYIGDSPFELKPPKGVRNPVLTREDVSDVTAAVVADPFMLRVSDTWFMFFEVFNWKANKGEIGLATSCDGMNWAYQQIVIAERFHLSYPYVFEWMNEYYLIPESHQAGSVRLYKATHFPTEWSFVGTLLEGPYFVDASLIYHDRRWWLFTEANPERKHDTLHLYYADALSGPWRPHATRPAIARNARTSRPAGRVIVNGGRLFRYAQSCVPTYGTEVRALEVTTLSTSSYREREIDRSPVLAPTGVGWNAHGMHHIDPHRLNDGRWLACVDGWARCQ